jgi:hypothetical protein
VLVAPNRVRGWRVGWAGGGFGLPSVAGDSAGLYT